MKAIFLVAAMAKQLARSILCMAESRDEIIEKQMKSDEYMDYFVVVTMARNSHADIGARGLPVHTSEGFKFMRAQELGLTLQMNNTGNNVMGGSKAQVYNILEACGYEKATSPFGAADAEKWYKLRVPRNFVKDNMRLM